MIYESASKTNKKTGHHTVSCTKNMLLCKESHSSVGFTCGDGWNPREEISLFYWTYLRGHGENWIRESRIADTGVGNSFTLCYPTSDTGRGKRKKHKNCESALWHLTVYSIQKNVEEMRGSQKKQQGRRLSFGRTGIARTLFIMQKHETEHCG